MTRDRGEARRLAKHALVVRRRRRRSVRRRELGVPCNPETLCGRDALVIETVLHTAVKDTNTHHRQQLTDDMSANGK